MRAWLCFREGGRGPAPTVERKRQKPRYDGIGADTAGDILAAAKRVAWPSARGPPPRSPVSIAHELHQMPAPTGPQETANTTMRASVSSASRQAGRTCALFRRLRLPRTTARSPCSHRGSKEARRLAGRARPAGAPRHLRVARQDVAVRGAYSMMKASPSMTRT